MLYLNQKSVLLFEHNETCPYQEEYESDDAVAAALDEIAGLLGIFFKIMNPLGRGAGLGQKLLAVLSTEEASTIFGALDCSLILTSVKQASRGSTAGLFSMSAYKLANWQIRKPRSFERSEKSSRWPNPRKGDRKFEKRDVGKNTLIKKKF